MKNLVLIGCLIGATLSSLAQTSNYQKEAETGHPSGIIKDLKTLPKSINFLVMGDWGRHGELHQRNVAEQMSNATVGLGATFNIITGDNFYPEGVASIYDPSWQRSFENVYNQHPLYDDWYVILGNHDYKTNPDAQVAYSKISARWHMPARYFSMVKNIKGTGTVEFFFIDSNPFQKDYYKDEDYGANVAKTDTAAQKLWLEKGLKNSKATWKIVVGHHPLYSAGKRKGKTNDMLYGFAPLFEKYHVDAYLCGHEHQLEFDQPEAYHFIECISGAGSEATEVTAAPYAKFAAQDFGFLAVSVTAREMLLKFINDQGKILYTTSMKK